MIKSTPSLKLTEDQEEALANFEAAERLYRNEWRRIENLFLPLVYEAIEANDIKRAEAIMEAIPASHVIKSFAILALRKTGWESPHIRKAADSTPKDSSAGADKPIKTA